MMLSMPLVYFEADYAAIIFAARAADADALISADA